MSAHLQGSHVDNTVCDRIIECLRDTEMTLAEISRRFKIHKSIVCKLNKQQSIRKYIGHSRWYVGEKLFDITMGVR